MSENKIDIGWYWEVMVLCPSELLDVFTFHLFEAGVSGTQELSQTKSQIELKLYFNGGTPEPSQVVDAIKKKMEGSDNQIQLLKVEKKKVENWQANWKNHFKPLEIGNNFIVLPPWEKKKSSKKKIIIQPGFGFGTGYHESTNLALQLLEWFASDRMLKSILDVGTGSGILAIASLLLGAEKVSAIDIDQEAVAEVSGNLKLSGFEPDRCRIEVKEPATLHADPFDLILANIEDHILVNIASDLIHLTKPGGSILLSGILTERKQILLSAFNGVREIKELDMNEWTGLILQKV